MVNPLFDETKDHLLMSEDPIPDRNAWFDPPAMELPAVVPAAQDLSMYDQFAERTDNGLRPEDAALSQPPQDPRWLPGADD